MKKNVIRFILAAFLFLCVPTAFKSSVLANEDDEHRITVKGGHAVDADGNNITSARAGTSFQVVPDDGNGKYWKSWKSQDDSDSYDYIFWYNMPDHDVEFTAQTVTARKTIVIDLTKPSVTFAGDDAALLKNALIAYSGTTTAFGGYDFDGDGTIDVNITNRDGKNIDVNRGTELYGGYYQEKELRYSLGTSYTLSIPRGEVGIIRFIVNNAESEYPVLDRTSKAYAIQVNGGTCNLTEAIPGTGVRTDVTYSKHDYLKEIQVNGINGGTYYYYSYSGFSNRTGIYFLMPPRDVEITFIMAPQERLDISFDENCRWKADDIVEVEAAIKQASGFETCVRAGKYGFDFDNDFDLDLELDSKRGLVIIHRTAYTERNSGITFQNSVGGDRSKYWPVYVSFDNLPDATPTPGPGQTATSAPTAALTAVPTATPTEIATPTPDVRKLEDEAQKTATVLKYILIIGGVLLFCALFVVAIVLLKKDGTRKSNRDSYRDWNEDRITIQASNGATAHKKKTADTSDSDAGDDGKNG